MAENKTDILSENNIKVDFLLDSDKADVENEILSRLAKSAIDKKDSIKIEEPKTELIGESLPLKSPTDLRNEDSEFAPLRNDDAIIQNMKTPKNKLMDQFIELQKSQGEIKYALPELKRMKKEDLVKLIANYTNSVMTQTAAPTIESVTCSRSGSPEEQDKQRVDAAASLEVVANGIFGINLALVSVLETGSFALKSKTGNVALLESWTERVNGRKDAFLFIFKQIYKDYKSEIDKYLSPLAQYAIIMAQTATETVILNIKKNKEQLPEESK